MSEWLAWYLHSPTHTLFKANTPDSPALAWKQRFCFLFNLCWMTVKFTLTLTWPLKIYSGPTSFPSAAQEAPGEGKSKERKNRRNRKDNLPPIPSILTDSRGGLQLTPLILYTSSHSLSPSIYLFLSLPHWLTHSCSRSIKLIKGSILSWSPLANTSANQ